MIKYFCDICQSEVNYSGYWERQQDAGGYTPTIGELPRHRVYVSVRPENSNVIFCPVCSEKILREFLSDPQKP